MMRREAYKQTVTERKESFVVTLLKVARRICPCFWAMKVALERPLISRGLVEAKLRFISLRILLLADAVSRCVLSVKKPNTCKKMGEKKREISSRILSSAIR
jgi:hypothetical protein